MSCALVVALAGCGSSSATNTSASSSPSASISSSHPGTSTAPPGAGVTAPGSTQTTQGAQLGFEGMPLEAGPALAPASTTQTAAIDGIQCNNTEQLVYHIHAHLMVYVDGAPRSLPSGIGIPGSVEEQTAQGPVASGGTCIYWLHTHAPDGVIHIESPTARKYTLGEFFDEWHQPLSSHQVAGATGKVTAWVNAKRWSASPRAIVLLAHADIQLDVGTPTAPFRSVSWVGTGL